MSILYLWQATGTDSVADPDPAPRCQNYLYWRLPVRTVFRIRILLLGVKIISVARYRYGLLRIRILHWSVKKIPGISITYRNWQDNYCISCTGMFSSLWKEDFFSFSTGYVKTMQHTRQNPDLILFIRCFFASGAVLWSRSRP